MRYGANAQQAADFARAKQGLLDLLRMVSDSNGIDLLLQAEDGTVLQMAGPEHQDRTELRRQRQIRAALMLRVTRQVDLGVARPEEEPLVLHSLRRQVALTEHQIRELEQRLKAYPQVIPEHDCGFCWTFLHKTQ